MKSAGANEFPREEHLDDENLYGTESAPSVEERVKQPPPKRVVDINKKMEEQATEDEKLLKQLVSLNARIARQQVLTTERDLIFDEIMRDPEGKEALIERYKELMDQWTVERRQLETDISLVGKQVLENLREFADLSKGMKQNTPNDGNKESKEEANRKKAESFGAEHGFCENRTDLVDQVRQALKSIMDNNEGFAKVYKPESVSENPFQESNNADADDQKPGPAPKPDGVA